MGASLPNSRPSTPQPQGSRQTGNKDFSVGQDPCLLFREDAEPRKGFDLPKVMEPGRSRTRTQASLLPLVFFAPRVAKQPLTGHNIGLPTSAL